MIKIHHFNEAYQLYQQHKLPFRLLQDQAALVLGFCQYSSSTVSNPIDITQTDMDWLIQQPEALQDYSNCLGGYVNICETETDLLQIHGCDFEWAEMHNGNWPNVTDMPMSWDACNYINEALGESQWVIFLFCWNNAGGPVYYVPKHLWELARVTEHIEATNTTSNI